MALRDWSQMNPENIRMVTAPLKIETIKEFFENKDLFFIVNYAESQIKGNMFLTYLSNLDLAYELDMTKAPVEEKFELIRIYMETRNLNNSDVLKLTVAELMLIHKGIDTSEMFNSTVLTDEEKTQFIQKHPDLISKWDQFIDSSYIYMIKSLPKLNDEMKIEGQFKEVTDPNFIGLNVVQMYGIPGFLDTYLASPPRQEICYFKHQFEDYMFNGKNLYHYFYCPENTVLLALEAVCANQVSGEEFIAVATNGAV